MDGVHGQAQSTAELDVHRGLFKHLRSEGVLTEGGVLDRKLVEVVGPLFRCENYTIGEFHSEFVRTTKAEMKAHGEAVPVPDVL